MKTLQYSTLAVIILGLLIWTLDASDTKTYQLRITPDSVRRAQERAPAIDEPCSTALESKEFFDNVPTIKRCELEEVVCYYRGSSADSLSCVKK